MAGKENCLRVTKAAARKRAATTVSSEDSQFNKKRIVLGELPNVSNVVVSRIPNFEKDPKTTRGTVRAKKNLVVPQTSETVKDVEWSVDNDAMSDDPHMCGTYASDIYAYMDNLEVKPNKRPLPNYFEKIQKDITPHMRGVLIDWLVEVSEEYNLVSDTLYLAVSYIDRFLSLNTVKKQKLQLLGVSSMLIASKYEEINPPNVEDFCYITENTYTKQDVVKMEADILNSLKFELGSPTVKTFLRRFTRVSEEDFKTSHLQIEFLGCYLAELSLLDYNCVKFLPSMVAASVVFLARFIVRPKEHPWNLNLQVSTRYKPSDLSECVGFIHDLYLSRSGGTLEAVREKYKQHKFKCVAAMPSPPEVPESFFQDVSNHETIQDSAPKRLKLPLVQQAKEEYDVTVITDS